jgi:predicted MPP superfamily phosphohydrolase
VVLVSDLHINQNVKISKLEKMVEEINKNNPDVVVIAGDVLDNRKIPQPEKIAGVFHAIKSKYGVFACLGNHDVNFSVGRKGQEEEVDPVANFFENAEITVLRDEHILINNTFYMVGRLDSHPIGITQEKRMTVSNVLEGIDKEKPIIMLDHQPTELTEAEEGGVDIILSGHTHLGQIFPGNLIVRKIYENPYGYLKKGDMASIVTSGASTWGPPLRIGTDNEVVRIDLTFIGD